MIDGAIAREGSNGGASSSLGFAVFIGLRSAGFASDVVVSDDRGFRETVFYGAD